MNTKLSTALFFAVGTTLAFSASATPFSIDASAFSDAQVMIDFNVIGDTQPINSQYTSEGVTFGGALVGLTNPGDTSVFNGSTIASNWIYGGAGNTGATWSATFGSVQNLVGFLAETNEGDDITIEAFLGSVSLGSVNFAPITGHWGDFIGIGDLGGFDRITVTTANNVNGFFAMDNFRFEATASNNVPGTPTVPEPGTLALLGLGFASAAFARRR